MTRLLEWLSIFLGLLLLSFCGGCHVEADFLAPKGTVSTRVVQADNPDSPATSNSGGKIPVIASTGSSHGIDEGLATLKPFTWIGIALVVLGIGLLVAGSRLPFIVPPHAGLFCIAAGGLMAVTPIFLDRYSTPIFVMLIVSAVCLIVWMAVRHHWFSGGGDAAPKF